MIEPSMISLSNPFTVCFAIQVRECLWFFKPIYCFLSHSIEGMSMKPWWTCNCDANYGETILLSGWIAHTQSWLSTTSLRLRLKSMEILIMNNENSCFQSLWMFDIIFINPWASQPPPPEMDRRLMESIDGMVIYGWPTASTYWMVSYPCYLVWGIHKLLFWPPAHVKWLPIALNDPQKKNFSIKHFMEYHDKNSFQYAG